MAKRQAADAAEKASSGSTEAPASDSKKGSYRATMNVMITAEVTLKKGDICPDELVTDELIKDKMIEKV